MRRIIRKCINCGKEFEATRVDQLYCSPSCRVVYNRNQRKREDIERQATERRVLAQESIIETQTKKIKYLEDEISDLKRKLATSCKDLELAEKKLSTYDDGKEADKMTIKIGRRERDVYENLCELWETQNPEDYKKWVEKFKILGYSVNTYNLPILAYINNFLGFGMPDFRGKKWYRA